MRNETHILGLRAEYERGREEQLQELLAADEIDAEEQGFLMGYEQDVERTFAEI